MRKLFQGIIPAIVAVVLNMAPATTAAEPKAGPRDTRNIVTGLRIPDQGYCDQPYVVVLPNGHWLCTLTTGPGHEGAGGQHVVSTTSTDKGHTWSELVDIEPALGPEASWVIPLLTPSGRVYVFYDYNGDRVRTLRGRKIRADMFGWYCYRYSDDFGRSWSKQRYRLPMRVTACDRENDWKGKVQIFWGICKPRIVGDDVYFSFTKIGKYMLDLGEGWVYHSDNILHQRDVGKIHWQLLPDGDHGIRAKEFGSIQEEHNLVALSDGQLYCVYRTTMGYPCHTYSRDGGHSWLKPETMTYTPGGRKIKTPRACPKVWRTKEGKFLFWFHNHGGKTFADRNPAWLTGGIEKNGRIHWSQPEILLYDDDLKVRMSYPDLIEQDGHYWVTETQKTIARIHQLDNRLLEGLWDQGACKTIARKGLVLDLDPSAMSSGNARLPSPLKVSTHGISLDLWVHFSDLAPDQVLLDSRTEQGKGMLVSTAPNKTIRIELFDGTNRATWDGDPNILDTREPHHIVLIVDAGPKIISTVVDGVLCDGGPTRQYGWGRYKGELGDVSGTGTLRVAPKLHGQLRRVRLYDRYLRTSEAVANYHAGASATASP